MNNVIGGKSNQNINGPKQDDLVPGSEPVDSARNLTKCCSDSSQSRHVSSVLSGIFPAKYFAYFGANGEHNDSTRLWVGLSVGVVTSDLQLGM